MNKLFTIAVALALTATGQAADTTKKPNIIFILADDLGYGEVGFTGQQKIKTPSLDKMAEDGAVLTDFHAGAPVCGPSRATLFYGQHTGHSPIRGNPKWTQSGNAVEMKADDVTLTTELKRAGYATAIFGKWGMNENLETNTGHPLKQGFDEFVGFNTHAEAHYHWPSFVWNGYEKIDFDGEVPGSNRLKRKTYADDIFQEKALDYIDRKADEEKPFFLYLAYTIPHLGYTAPEESRKFYKTQNWEVRPAKKDRGRGYEYDEDINISFAAMVSHMDGYIAQLRAKLVEKGIDKNTLIFFTSDNGPMFTGDFFNSSGVFRGKKRYVSEGGIRVPTVVVWPGVVEAKTKINLTSALWDILPTFCEIAGIETSVKTDGISILAALKGDKSLEKQKRVLYWEFNEGRGPQQAIRFGKWKAIRQWDKKAGEFGAIQLYNLEKDLGEASNLASQNPEISAEMLKFMLASRTENAEFPLVPTVKKRTRDRKR